MPVPGFRLSIQVTAREKIEIYPDQMLRDAKFRLREPTVPFLGRQKRDCSRRSHRRSGNNHLFESESAETGKPFVRLETQCSGSVALGRLARICSAFAPFD